MSFTRSSTRWLSRILRSSACSGVSSGRRVERTVQGAEGVWVAAGWVASGRGGGGGERAGHSGGYPGGRCKRPYACGVAGVVQGRVWGSVINRAQKQGIKKQQGWGHCDESYRT